jgi:hypothetical protein
MVLATPLEEVGADRARVPALAESVKARCLKVLEAVNRARPDLRESLDAVASAGALCDQVAAAVVPSPDVRQALLGELDVERRLERLAEALGDVLRQLTGER